MRLWLALAAAALAAVALSIPAQGAAPERILAGARLAAQRDDGFYWSVRDRGGNRIGYLVMDCSPSLQGIRQCTASLSLPGGKVHFSGSLRHVTGFSLTLTGSSGAYAAHQRGDLVVTQGRVGWTVGVHLR